MIKQTITYTDFNGDSRTEDFWFHLDKADLLKFQAMRKGGMKAYLEDIVASEKNEEILDTFEMFILKSVGRRSENGRQFIRNQEIRDEFRQTNAFSDFLFFLANNAEEGAKFVAGIMPDNLVEELEAAVGAKTVTTVELPADTSTNDGELVDEAKKAWYDYSREELLALDEIDFQRLYMGVKNPKPQLLLGVAMERRSRS